MARCSGSEGGARNVKIPENKRHSTAQVREGSGELVLPQNTEIAAPWRARVLGACPALFSSPILSVAEGLGLCSREGGLCQEAEHR